MKTLKQLKEIQEKINTLQKEYDLGVELAEKAGHFEEIVDKIVYQLVVSECKREIINPEKFYEAYRKEAIQFMTVKTAKAREHYGAEKINAMIDDMTPYKTRKITVKKQEK